MTMPFSFKNENHAFTDVRTVQNSQTSTGILNPESSKQQKSELKGQEEVFLAKVQVSNTLKQGCVPAMPMTVCAISRTNYFNGLCRFLSVKQK